jgi:NitT/TauT family transport system substrate-binding protein
VDNSRIEEFRRSGGESVVRSMALKAMQLSQERANEVLKRLKEKYPQIEKNRLEAVGRGWDEPVSQKPEENMRVEVQWFLVE